MRRFRIVHCAAIWIALVTISSACIGQTRPALLGDAPAFREQLLPDAPSPQVSNGQQAVAVSDEKVPLELQPHAVVELSNMPKHFTFDAVHIFVSPVYLRKNDLKWMLPLAGAVATSFALDHKTMTEVVSTNPSFNQSNINVSDAIRDSFIAVPGMLWAVGQVRNQEHPKEAGLLASEAMIDAYVVNEVVKIASFRERPLVDQGRGRFYVGSSGLNSSFVSGHSMVSWASAAVLAEEFPSPWAKAGIYAASTTVSLTRVLGQQHFPTDVLLGAAGGWLIGHYVFRAHHHYRRPKAI